MRYFEVKAKCGHVGKNYYIPVRFAVVSQNGKSAAAYIRQRPRVKHDHKDAILHVREITFEEFMVLRANNDADPYLHCKNIQEQRGIENLADRLVPEKRREKVKTRNVEFKIKKNKIGERTARKTVDEYYCHY